MKFVGVFVYNKDRAYTNAQWALLKKVDRIELDPPQMRQYIDGLLRKQYPFERPLLVTFRLKSF